MLDVPYIQLQALIPRDVVPAMNLGPAGYTRSDRMPEALCVGIERQVAGEQWSWSDQTHVTNEDIHELWQLVEAPSPEESTPPTHAAVLHRSELEHREDAFFEAGSFLPKKDRKSHIDQDPNSDN